MDDDDNDDDAGSGGEDSNHAVSRFKPNDLEIKKSSYNNNSVKAAVSPPTFSQKNVFKSMDTIKAEVTSAQPTNNSNGVAKLSEEAKQEVLVS